MSNDAGRGKHVAFVKTCLHSTVVRYFGFPAPLLLLIVVFVSSCKDLIMCLRLFSVWDLIYEGIGSLMSIKGLRILCLGKCRTLICKTVTLNCCFSLQVPLSKFQELRYNVALILKEMNDLERKSILQIQD